MLRPAPWLAGVLVLAAASAAAQTREPVRSAETARAAAPRDERARPSETAYFEFLRGRHLEAQGRLPEALEAYEAASRVDPQSAQIRAEIAALYARQGKMDEAVREARRALTLDEQSVEAHWVLGTVYASQLDARAEVADIAPVAPRPSEDAGETSAPGSAVSEESTIEAAILHLEQARPGRRFDNSLHVTLGRLYLTKQAWPKAIEVLFHVVEREPDAVEASFLLAQAYDGAGDRPRAIAALERALVAEPGLFRGILYLADLYARERRWDDAAAAYGRASAAHPENHDLKLRHAAALASGGNAEGARDLLRELAKARPDDPRVLFLSVDVERALKDYDAAEATARRLMAAQPGQRFGAQALAQVYADRREYRQVVATLEPFLAKAEAANEPARPLVPLRLSLGLAYLDLREFDKAVATFERARKDGGDETMLDVYLAQALLSAGEFARAAEVASRARQQNPQDIRLLGVEAQARLKSGERASALKLLEDALATRANDPQAYVALAGLHFEARDFKRAEDVLQTAASRFPGEITIAFQLGATLEEQQRYDEAEGAFRRALELDPLHAPSLNYLGYMFAERGERLDEALRLIALAVKQDPFNGSYLDSLGWAYFKKGSFDQARDFLLKAGEQLPDNSVVQDHIGDVLFALNDRQGAIAAWERALAGDGRSIERTTIERKISRARARE